ncbi:hypothetical protein H6P81_001189 [Aristolochia fimbriata]|uniref:Uncharacterized protein n=1 Tax=Aristolochia fimbriata TaxID=158543 RepID=A0AAV7F7F7_ARIFI|nr:hypothetical protein H6P81_001189 [Aristolochia fimbriata]
MGRVALARLHFQDFEEAPARRTRRTTMASFGRHRLKVRGRRRIHYRPVDLRSSSLQPITKSGRGRHRVIIRRSAPVARKPPRRLGQHASPRCYTTQSNQRSCRPSTLKPTKEEHDPHLWDRGGEILGLPPISKEAAERGSCSPFQGRNHNNFHGDGLQIAKEFSITWGGEKSGGEKIKFESILVEKILHAQKFFLSRNGGLKIPSPRRNSTHRSSLKPEKFSNSQFVVQQFNRSSSTRSPATSQVETHGTQILPSDHQSLTGSCTLVPELKLRRFRRKPKPTIHTEIESRGSLGE